jgi:hypothetical protein
MAFHHEVDKRAKRPRARLPLDVEDEREGEQTSSSTRSTAR